MIPNYKLTKTPNNCHHVKEIAQNQVMIRMKNANPLPQFYTCSQGLNKPALFLVSGAVEVKCWHNVNNYFLPTNFSLLKLFINNDTLV